MALFDKRTSGAARPGQTSEFGSSTANEISRFGIRRNSDKLEKMRGGNLSLETTDKLASDEKRAITKKVVIWAVLLIVLMFISFGIVGIVFEGGSTLNYSVFGPVQVIQTFADYIQLWESYIFPFIDSPYSDDAFMQRWETTYMIGHKIGVVFITLVCAILLSVSGMLYQNVFKNPIAGPGMLGVSSGVTFGCMLLCYLFGSLASGMVWQRYLVCYILGAVVLLVVILAGKKLSGKGRSFDITTLLLMGMIISQLLGYVVSFYTLFVMDPEAYAQYVVLSEMLTVDTSIMSWLVLAVACLITLVPVFFLRFRFNALAYTDDEARALGINMTVLRTVALVLGGIMVLAAQVHIGAVAMVSLIVPFLARGWFGCEFKKQLIGNVCVSTIFMLICRDLADLIPFVGLGIGIGNVVNILALPLFILVMSSHIRGWE